MVRLTTKNYNKIFGTTRNAVPDFLKPKKKKKKKKKKYYLGLPIEESPTLKDIRQENKEQKRNQDEYWIN